jgi:hypothetical protein
MLLSVDWIAVLVGTGTSIGLLLHRNWRWGAGLLAIQYLVVFWLVHTHWPVSMAAAKLVTGWMVCAILVISRFASPQGEELESSWPKGRLFRLFSAGIILASSLALSIRTSEWLGLGLPITWGSFILVGMGILQLGISARASSVILGLLTTLAGFEILYAAVESSTLVASLLALLNLGLALAGSYLLSLPLEERS